MELRSGGPVVKNPSANVGDTGSISGLGRFHMPLVKRGLYSTTTEAHVPTACALQQEEPLRWEAWAQLQSVTHSQLEKTHTSSNQESAQPCFFFNLKN